MSLYGGTVTNKGREMLASLVTGDTLEITRAVVGTGVVDEGVALADVTDLVSYIADAEMTVPLVYDHAVKFSIEYRNDNHTDIQSVIWINEIGVYAKSAKMTEPVLFYYATLGDTPQPVSPFKDNRVDVRRYPITIAMTLGEGVTVDYIADAFVRSQEVAEMVDKTIGDFTHQFFHIGNTKPTVTPAFWFDTSVMDQNAEVLLILNNEDTPVSAVIEEQERGVENATADNNGTEIEVI